MADVKNCRRCGKIYTYMGGLAMLCPACRDRDEQDYKRVKDYLYDNPGATMSEISNVLEISVDKITRFLREGRLEILDETNLVLACEKCGKAIKSGRFCDDCMKNIATDLRATSASIKSDLDKESEKEGAKERMRYLNKKD